MGKKGYKRIYVADFETRAGEKAEEEGETWVYLWAICAIDEMEKVVYGSSIEKFIRYVKNLGNVLIYFHNLKFDGRFILDYLLRNGYKHVLERSEFKQSYKNIMALIDDMTSFFNIIIHGNKNCRVEFRDSSKKIVGKVRDIAVNYNTKYQKLDYDYTTDRAPNTILTDHDKNYVANDVKIIAEVLEGQYKNGYDKLTTSSDALQDFKRRFGEDKFKRFFPTLDEEVDTFVRRAYKGGWCYVKEDIEGEYLKKEGETYDVNGLYSWAMHSDTYFYYGLEHQNIYPIYNGVYYKGFHQRDKMYPLFIQRLYASFKLREGYLPTIQLKNNFRYAQNEYITESEGVEELYLTNVDLDLFFLHYEVDYFEMVDGYKFMGIAGLFDEYINYHNEGKMTSKGAKKQLHKLMLNALYGKFGQSIDGGIKQAYFDEVDDIVKYNCLEGTPGKGVYSPVACFCTSYARRWTIYHAQINYDKFCYSDTDSVHGFKGMTGFLIDDKKLGYWKHEGDWVEAKFLRQKTYMEKEHNGDWMIKCAGMPDNVKEAFIDDIKKGVKTIDDFDVGLSYERMSLKPKTVRGGCLLVATDFSIK